MASAPFTLTKKSGTRIPSFLAPPEDDESDALIKLHLKNICRATQELSTSFNLNSTFAAGVVLGPRHFLVIFHQEEVICRSGARSREGGPSVAPMTNVTCATFHTTKYAATDVVAVVPINQPRHHHHHQRLSLSALSFTFIIHHRKKKRQRRKVVEDDERSSK